MNKNEYLEEKIEFYRQEVERYKTMILHEKEDTVRKEFLEDELEAAEEMFEMFVTINTQVIAWDTVKDSITMPMQGTFEINNTFTSHTPMVDDEIKYHKIFETLQYDPEINLKKLLDKAKPCRFMDL